MIDARFAGVEQPIPELLDSLVRGNFEVRVRDRRVARLTGIPRAASVTIRLPVGTSRVEVTGETLGGQTVRSVRSYTVCEPEPAPDEPPLTLGGGED